MQSWKLAPDLTLFNDFCLFRSNIDHLPIGLVAWQTTDRPAYWNPRFEELTGWTAEESSQLSEAIFWERLLPTGLPRKTGPALLPARSDSRIDAVYITWENIGNLAGEPVGRLATIARLEPVKIHPLYQLVSDKHLITHVFHPGGPAHLSLDLVGKSEDEALARLQQAVDTGRLVPFQARHEVIQDQIELLSLTSLEPTAALLGTKDLIAATAHELRNPLATIRGFLQILPKASPEDRDRYVSILVREVDRLGEVLTGVLEHADRDSAPAVPTDAIAVISEALGYMIPEARPLQIDLGWLGGQSPAEPAWVSIPAGRLLQVVINLMQNAIDAVPLVSGRIAVHIATSGGRVRLMVDDNGPGWSGTIRASSVLRPPGRRSGHGLGLAISRWLLVRHRGTLQHEPSPLGGTRAVIDLPEETPPEPDWPGDNLWYGQSPD